MAVVPKIGTFPGKVGGILVCVDEHRRTYMPIGIDGSSLVPHMLNAFDFAVWLRTSQLSFLSAQEFQHLEQHFLQR